MDNTNKFIEQYKSKLESLSQYIEKKEYPEELDEQLEALKNDGLMQLLRDLRQDAAGNRYRPIYHFAAFNWIGDPNGLCYWQGNYHCFYQGHLPGMRGVCWGHAVSEDLVHWRDLPFAFAADDTDLSCYSGQTWVEQDRVIAIYHGKGAGNCIAESSDPLLLNWRKHPNNPVIPNGDPDECRPFSFVALSCGNPDFPTQRLGKTPTSPPKKGYPYRVFDPCIWKEDDGYYSLSGTYRGSPRERRQTCVHLFFSKDLTNWEYLHPLVEDAVFCTMGDDGACPNFWPVGNGKHVLTLFSHRTGSRYYVGEYDKKTHKFHIDYHRRFSHNGLIGNGIGTPSTSVDHKNRNITIFNYHEMFKDGNPLLSLGSGVFSLPIMLKAKDRFPVNDSPYKELEALRFNPLTIDPVPEVESLRFNGKKVENLEIQANEEIVLEGIGSKSVELKARIHIRDAREAGFYVLRSPGGEEKTKISVMNVFHGKFPDSLLIDTTQSSLRTDVGSRPPENAPLALREDRIVELRIFIDRSMIEVFADSEQFAAVRVCPEREDSRDVSIFAKGDRITLLSLECWQMKAISPELAFREGD